MTEEQINNFRNKISLTYKEKNIVTDGIVQLECFKNSKHRILWILKEPYGEGGFDYSNYIQSFEYKKPFPTSGNMWYKIIYTTYGILNDYERWNDFGNLKKDKNIFDARLSFALINLKKIPGTTQSSDGEIIEFYQNYKDLLHEQIELIKPDIVICGSTFKFLDFDISKTNPLSNGDLKGYKYKNRIFIDAYHPSYTYNQEQYCNEIITVCEEFFLNRKDN